MSPHTHDRDARPATVAARLAALSALPPSEMNGSGRPVIGISPTTPPMLMIACPTNQIVIDAATIRRNGSSTRRAIRRPV